MGLLGANVAGKTTLMRMIADIMEPSNGSISFNGEGIRKMGADYRNIFGFLPQDFGYSRDFTVKDYLEYVAALKDVPPRETTKKINHLLDILTLSDVKGKNLADHSEVEGLIPAEPRLEDLYLWLFPQEVHG